MSIIDTIDRLARTFILPLNDKLTDVEVWESVLAHDTFVVQFVYVGDLTPKERDECSKEMRSLFKMISPKIGETIRVAFWKD